MSQQIFRVLSWNILAPELLRSFWSKSYGFDQKAYSPQVDAVRVRNIIETIRPIGADVIALQEITDQRYAFLDGLSLHDFIARDLGGYRVVSTSFKSSGGGRAGDVNTGVATLAKSGIPIKTLATAETFGPSKLFTSGLGSPFTLDAIQYFADRPPFYLVNVHVRMQFPNIAEPLEELTQRLTTVITSDMLPDLVAVGDFNAHQEAADRDFRKSRLFQNLICVQGRKGQRQPQDDYCLIGAGHAQDYNVGDYEVDTPVLALNADARGKAHNRRVLESGTITSDHPPIVLDLTPK